MSWSAFEAVPFPARSCWHPFTPPFPTESVHLATIRHKGLSTVTNWPAPLGSHTQTGPRSSTPPRNTYQPLLISLQHSFRASPPLTRPHGVPSCVGCLGSPRGRKPRSSCHPNLLLPICFPDPLFCSRAPFEKEEKVGRIPHWVLVYRRSTLKSFPSWKVSSFQTSTRTLYSC